MNRLYKIDELRGLTLISMIAYHFCWDLKYIAGFEMDWYTSLTGKVWQKSICMTFILISGFCFSMGSKRFKRSMTIFLCGLVITVVTLLVMPQNRIIFGVLTFTGTAGLLTIPVDKLLGRGRKDEKTLHAGQIGHSLKAGKVELCKPSTDTRFGDMLLLVVFLVLFVVFFSVNKHYLNLFFTKVALPESLCTGYVNTFLGFTDRTFFSTDYFSLLPWYFLYLCGYFLHRLYAGHVGSSKGYTDNFKGYTDISKGYAGSSNITAFLAKPVCKPLSLIGRHTLIIYMVHQPVLYAITLLFVRK